MITQKPRLDYLFLVTDLVGYGGIQIYARSVLEAGLKTGPARWGVLVLTGIDSVTSKAYAKNENLEVIGLHRIENRLVRRLALLGTFLLTIGMRRPKALLANHVQFAPLCLFARMLRIPVVLFSYGVESRSLSLMGKWALRAATRVVTISRYTQDVLLGQVPALAGKIRLVPPMVSGTQFLPNSRPSDLAKRYGVLNSRVLLSVTRLASTEKDKGCDIVIKAMPVLLRSFPDLKYMIAGAGPDTPRLAALAHELKVGSSVLFLGFVSGDELAGLYNLCDVFVLPSAKEGFGIVYLEAAATGKPVVGGAAGGAPEALLDGDLGLLVRPGDSQGLAEAVSRILRREVRESLVSPEELRRRALAAFGPEAFDTRLRPVLEEVRST